MDESVARVLEENSVRNKSISTPFNPITGYNSVGERFLLKLEGFPLGEMWLPVQMKENSFVKKLIKKGLYNLAEEIKGINTIEDTLTAIIEQFVRIRCKYDFPFWAALYVYIKNKGGGDDVLFVLSRPQRKFVEKIERFRNKKKPIRIIMLKARQWGGSTTSQIYMAWLQLIHKKGLNSLIIAHQGTASDEIKDMFDRLIKHYPIALLYKIGEEYNKSEPVLVSVGKSGNTQRVKPRNFKIKLGTAERPDSCRGGDYSLIHCSEVAIWKTTEGKTPEDIIRAACSGVLYQPYTMIIYESTANGVGNFFHGEYMAAKKGHSQFESLFIAWYDIDQYSLPFNSEEEKELFAGKLYHNRNSDEVVSDREEPGKYLWWLWEKGATLEAIHWYIEERKSKTNHGMMAAEYPSDDIEAFVESGDRVFSMYAVEKFRAACKAPIWKGELSAMAEWGSSSLMKINMMKEEKGTLWIWEMPEIDKYIRVRNRYVVAVDIGGRSKKADWSVIAVFDRFNMMDGGKPSVVAQWYGHVDMDILAWKAAQIAKIYDEALLVIESNTLETHDRERNVDGDQSHYILNQIASEYPNLYARKQSEEEIIQQAPKKYGFHTNTATKPMVISSLIRVVREGLYTERDERCLDEYITYERKPNGAFGAVIGMHDDLLMTRAIGLHICFNEMPLPVIVEKGQNKIKQKRITAINM